MLHRSKAAVPLTEAQALAAFERRPWLGWRRPEQMPPGGDWRTWLILAGRGWGKTRTGAEWVLDKIEDGYQRVALVGPTAADVRDVMVEGESGLLAVAPEDMAPNYEPSKRRITFANGALCTTFSADEPDRLRGPQHDAAWCLVGDTPVTMSDGSTRPLADIASGDMVMTRFGPRVVVGSAMTNPDAVLWQVHTVDGQTITGTEDHPVFVHGRGFTPIGQLRRGDRVCTIHTLSSTESVSTVTHLATTRRAFACTARYGNRTTDQSRLVTTFITSTATSRTTELKTWNCCRTAITRGGMLRKNLAPTVSAPYKTHRPLWRAIAGSGYPATSPVLSAEASFIAAPRTPPGSAHRRALKLRARGRSMVKRACASGAARHTMPRGARNVIAQRNAIAERMLSAAQAAQIERLPARTAARRLSPSASTLVSARVHAPCVTTGIISTVERLPTTAPVYDIAVDDAREFFAGGILVHNCDEVAAWRYPEAWDQLQFGLRLGDDPRCIVTTTPRPTKEVRELVKASTTVVTRGSTFDNADNLAPAFLERILAKYEGTRLGRQELYAEILDDVPGALWTRAMLEAAVTGYTEPADMQRVVVAVDPAVTSGEDSDETGIVVAGRDVRQGYVLGDYTCRLSPDGWARRAVEAYHQHKADRIVAEANQGGDMVRTVLRTVDPTVPVKLVHATRGKRVRAEPVAALYEQGRVFHAAVFAELEDQLVTWTPDSPSSPDRLDALVWAFTDLDLARPASARAVAGPRF